MLAILQVHPQARGTLFDLPHVADTARLGIAAHGDHGRCESVGGDCFQSLLPGGDVLFRQTAGATDMDDGQGLQLLGDGSNGQLHRGGDRAARALEIHDIGRQPMWVLCAEL